MTTNQLGKETIPVNESEYITKTIDILEKKLVKEYPNDKETQRFFHPKMHAIVKATLEVPNDLPTNLQTGIFQPGKSYQCWVRFSTGKRQVVSDADKALRGVAIKVMNVPGRKVLEGKENETTQDFVMGTSSSFETADVKTTYQGSMLPSKVLWL